MLKGLIANFLPQAGHFPSVFSNVKEYLSLRDQRKELQTKPVAILFYAKRKVEQT